MFLRVRICAAVCAAVLLTVSLTGCGENDAAGPETFFETSSETMTERAFGTTEEETEESAEEENTVIPQGKGEDEEEMLDINNVRISVKEAGEGPDMILIHGRTHAKESMDPLFEYYKERYHVVSYDVRGHGKTESAGEFTLDDLSDDLAGVIRAYQMEKPVVIGFSMGSYIALKTAERYPDLLSGIVLIGTRGGRTSSPWPSIDEVGRALESFDNLTDAPKVTVPALVLSGENDRINPAPEGKKVADALPEAEYFVVPDAEHMAYAGNPDFVFEKIDAYLKRMSAE